MEIEDLTLEHESVLHRQTQTHRNALIAICQLPTEVLCEIFLFASYEDARYTGRYISQVCTLWRSTALACPSLWSNLTFGYAGSSYWVEEMLKRSMDAPLTVCVCPEYTTTDHTMAVIAAALENIPRITELTLEHIPREMIEKLLVLTQPAKLLRRMTICLYYFPEPDAILLLPDDLFPGDAPTLEYLFTTSCFFRDWTTPCLRNLTELCVSMPSKDNATYPGNLFEALNTMSLLESLYLAYVRGAPPHVIRLPRLTSLHIHNSITDTRDFLRQIRVPSLMEDIGIYIDWMPDSASFDPTPLANLLAALNECSRSSTKVFTRPFHELSLSTSTSYSSTLSVIFALYTENVNHTYITPHPPDRVSFSCCSVEPGITLQASIAVEKALIAFLVATISLSDLRDLSIELVDAEESREVHLQLLAGCIKVEHLTMTGANPHFLLKQLGLVREDAGGAIVPIFLPHLRMLTIHDADFGLGGAGPEQLDAFMDTLKKRKDNYSKLQILVIHDACNLLAVDAERSFLDSDLVDRLDWMVTENEEDEEEGNGTDDED